MDDRKQALLARCPLFAGLNHDALVEAAGRGIVRRYRRRDVLFSQGDAADAFAVVLAGRIKLLQSGADGHEVIVRYVGAGEMCAVVALFPEQSYPATAEVVEDTEVILWTRERLEELFVGHPRLALNTTRLLAERMRELTSRLREVSTQRVAQRVARALLRLARKAGRRVEAGVLIDIPLSREDLAKLAGTTHFTVSRLLSDWEAAGIVELGRERVGIRILHGLVAIAEDLPTRPPGAEG